MTEPNAKIQAMSTLDQLKNFTTVVADTGDFEGKRSMKIQNVLVVGEK